MSFELIPPDQSQATAAPASGYELVPPADSSATATPDSGGMADVLHQLLRQGGLTARYLIEGVTGITDPINRALGLKSASAVTGQALTQAGLPEPQTALERVIGDASRGVTQAGVFGGAVGPALAKATGPITSAIGDVLSGNVGAQIAGGGSGGASSGTARELGFGPGAQLVAGLLGGVAGPAAGDLAARAASAAARGVGAYFSPFTRGGQEDVVGRLLNQFAEDPNRALTNIQTAPEYVPGSTPTTGTASADPGLLALQRALENEPESAKLFTRQAAENNAARLAALGDISGTPEGLAAAKAARDAQASQNYGSALGTPLNLTPQNQKDLMSIMQRPSMQTAMTTANKLAAEDGVNLNSLGMGDPQWLHYVKLGLDDLVGTAAQQGIGAVQRRAIIGTKNTFLDWLDSVNPAYQQARSAYTEASGPINRMETMQDIAARTQVAAPDILGNPVLSQAKWKQQTTTPATLGDLARVLSPDQMGTVSNIGEDLNRAALLGAGKAVGSNTVQNLAIGNVLSSALGKNAGSNPLARFLSYPLGIPYKWSGAEQQVQDLLDQAVLNPQLGARLMQSAPTAQRAALFAELQRRAAMWTTGATQGATAQVSGAQQ